VSAGELEAVRVAGPAGTLTGWTAGPDDASAPAVVFIHPINTQGRIWADVVARLAGTRRCLMPDLRAHGGSDTTGELGLDPWVDDVEAFAAAVGLDGPYHVVGGSLGGSLAVVLAARRPERVLSVTGMGSSLSFPAVDPTGFFALLDEVGTQEAFRRLLPEGNFGPDPDPATVRRAIELANPNDAETVKRVWHATVTSDSRALAAQVRVPALVITGEHDGTCTPALGLEMARALGTEQVLVPGVGHLPMLERPARMAELVERHLAEAEAVAAVSSS